MKGNHRARSWASSSHSPSHILKTCLQLIVILQSSCRYSISKRFLCHNALRLYCSHLLAWSSTWRSSRICLFWHLYVISINHMPWISYFTPSSLRPAPKDFFFWHFNLWSSLRAWNRTSIPLKRHILSAAVLKSGWRVTICKLKIIIVSGICFFLHTVAVAIWRN